MSGVGNSWRIDAIICEREQEDGAVADPMASGESKSVTQNSSLAVFIDGEVGLRLLTWLVGEATDLRLGVLHPSRTGHHQGEICKLLDGAGVPWLRYSPGDPARVTQQIDSRGLEFDYIACLWFGYILPPEILALPRVAGINTHPSFLPYNRGKHGNIWSIVEGTPAGASIHYLRPGIDDGPVLVRREVLVLPTDTGDSLYRRCQQATEDAFKEAWRALRAGKVDALSQADLGSGSYHSARDLKRLDYIDLDQQYRARDLIDILRARTFPPHPGARLRSGGKVFQIRVEIEELSED